MKAILVIDMPEACADGCPVMCRARGINHRPTWCPLKPMPIKWYEDESTSFANGIARGFNKCIDKITGETE